MKRYRLTPRANTDLREIYRYVARQNLPAARKLRRRFSEKFALLGKFPLLGEVRQDLSDQEQEIRTFSFDDFVIYYHAKTKSIDIARIARGSQDAPGLFPN